MTAPFAELQQGIVRNLAPRAAALTDGGDHCLHILPALMRDDTTAGMIYPIAYNAGVQVVKTHCLQFVVELFFFFCGPVMQLESHYRYADIGGSQKPHLFQTARVTSQVGAGQK